MGGPGSVMPCPYCGARTEADWVDVGVGFRQSGPFYCDSCGASEIGPYDAERPLSDAERETGWYAPGSSLGSSVNALGGVPVSHEVASAYYRLMGINPREHDP